MYRLLIVDDECQIADWLYELFIKMKNINLDVYKVYSGSEALEWLNRMKIDIVISDIYMPGIDGLQLMEKIDTNWPDCQLILLTGYNNFDYIYLANKYKGVSYILKTEDDEEIVRAVEKAIQEIEKKFKNEELLNKIRQQMKVSIPIMQKEFMQNILFNYTPLQDISQEYLDNLEIPLISTAPVLLILGRIDILNESVFDTTKRFQYIYTINQLFLYCFDQHPNKFFVEYDCMSFVFLFQPNGENQDTEICEFDGLNYTRSMISGKLEKLQEDCRKSLNFPISFIISKEMTPWRGIPEKAAYLKQLLEYGTGKILETILDEAGLPYISKNSLFLCKDSVKHSVIKVKNLDLLEAYLERGQKQEFYYMMKDIIECLRNIKSKNFNPALEIYYRISVFFLSYINKWELVDKIAFKIGLDKLTRVDAHLTWSEAVDYIYRLSEIIFEIRKSEHEKLKIDLITAIKEYVDKHLDEDLSLVNMAKITYYNPSYLSRLFKQETGVNLSEYIMKTRVATAKKLLESTGMKIQDIAETVGATSGTYLDYCFKKVMGISPNEYRKQFLKDKMIL